MRILVLEDDIDIRQLISQSLSQADYDVDSCADANSAMQIIAESRPDCLVVDWMLPDLSGIEFVRWLRRQKDFCTIPVLMLTAKAQETDKIKGLESGADDYMTKPMSLREMHARIQALLRRPAAYVPTTDIVSAGKIQINKKSREVEISGNPIELTPTEFKLLKLFVENPDKVFSRDQILNAVWGMNSYVDDRTVDVHILRLRKILKPFGIDSMVVTMRGAGYKLRVTE